MVLDSNLRQLSLMLNTIKNYDGSAFMLRKCISELEFLVQCLDGDDFGFKNNVLLNIEYLEMFSADLIVFGREELTDVERSQVRVVLDEMVKLIEKKMGGSTV